MSVENLKAVLTNLSPKDKVFAESLISYFTAKGMLSDKQQYWVGVLTTRGQATKTAPEPVYYPPVQESETVSSPTVQVTASVTAPLAANVGKMEGLYNLFNTAKATLQYPKIHLLVAGKPVMVYLGKDGIVKVTDGKPYGQNKYFGKVFTDGAWVKGKDADTDVEHLLKCMSLNPAATAKEFGKLSGRCCFCNKKLTDEHSTAAGFGETCSKKWNLHTQWKQATSLIEKAAFKERVKANVPLTQEHLF